MSKLIKTNAAYASLAYRRTVLDQVVTYLQREFIGLDTDPKDVLVCDEVFQADAKVPIEEVGYVVEDLIDEIEEIKLDMNKFEFGEREHASKRKERRKQKKQTRAKGKKDKGSTRSGESKQAASS